VTLRLLVADDNEIVRIGVRTLIKGRQEWQVCGEAENGREAIGRVWELSPDVVILDLSMPIMNGFEAATEIRRISPSIKIVLFSVHDVPTIATEVGADAFVSKTMLAQELIATIERVTGPPGKARARANSA
jgi:DNA-binding NarL/FixJ family response regulator